jgi:hypothetical protein
VTSVADAVDMWAKVVEAEMDPSRIDVAARAVRYDLIPHFEAQPGAGRHYWMANRTSGEVLVVTIWSDHDSLDACRSADGVIRTNVVERTGLTIRVVQTMEVLTAADPDLSVAPVRWARATWIGGVASNRGRDLATMRIDLLADQRRSSGFCGGYWFADVTTGAGLVLSLRNGSAGRRGSERDDDRTQCRLEDALDCTISRVSAYESLGVAVPGT